MAKKIDNFNAFRTDFIYRIINRLNKGNPFNTAFIYFIASFVTLYLIGLVTGQFGGKNGISPMYESILDNFNLALLAPAGAFLLCVFYNTINMTFPRLIDMDVIHPEDNDKYVLFCEKLDRLYNVLYLPIIFFIVSAAVNIYIHSVISNTWLGFKGGLTGLYGRLVIIINYYVILLVTYKSTVTIWAIQQIMKMKVNIKPFHTDHAGGLRMIGKLVFSVNYFMILILFFLTLLFFFDSFTHSQPLYLLIIAVFYFLSFYLLFASLDSTHVQMLSRKKAIMETLNATIQKHQQKIEEGIIQGRFDTEHTKKISELIQFTHDVHKIPVWPFDTNTLLKFFTTITIPLLIFLINIVVNSDSILYNMDKLKLLQIIK